jgi:hypothetical protein
MKRRSAPLDDLHLETLVILDDDGRFIARVMRRIVTVTYRIHRVVLLCVISATWRSSPTPSRFPDLGEEPFNLDPEELAEAWEPK